LLTNSALKCKRQVKSELFDMNQCDQAD